MLQTKKKCQFRHNNDNVAKIVYPFKTKGYTRDVT